MNVTDAAEKVLVQAGQPLTVREITREILDQGLWVSRGKTPEATVGAQLGTEIKYKQKDSRFVRTAPSTYAINDGNLPLVQPKKRKARAQTTPKSAKRLAREEKVSTSPMTYLEAAETVLTEDSDGDPMHYQTITKTALGRGLLAPKGLTPSATMNAQLVTNVNKAKATGDESRFTKLGKGFYGLSAWDDGSVKNTIAKHNRTVRKDLREKLHSMKPAEFEELVGQILAEMGFDEIEVTKVQGDGGIDVRGTLVVAGSFPVKMAVQVKRWKNNIQSPEVQKVRGAATADEKPLLITTSGFSKGARDEAEKIGATPVGLMGGEELVSLMIEHGIAVKRNSYDVIDLEDSNVQREFEV